MGGDDPRREALLAEARAARERAYAPYSRFRMGAAVATAGGALVPGSLVENVSLGLAMCAERVALFGTVAAGLGRPELLALVAPRRPRRAAPLQAEPRRGALSRSGASPRRRGTFPTLSGCSSAARA